MLRRVAIADHGARSTARSSLGATMRHTGAGLAIPDFPLAFGHLIPPVWNAKIADPLRASRRCAASSRSRSSRPPVTSAITTAAARELVGRRCCCCCFVLDRRSRSARSSVWSGLQPSSTRARRQRRARAGDVAGAHAAQLSQSFATAPARTTVRGGPASLRSGLREPRGPRGAAHEVGRCRASRPCAAAPATSSRWPSRGSTCSSSPRRSPGYVMARRRHRSDVVRVVVHCCSARRSSPAAPRRSTRSSSARPTR